MAAIAAELAAGDEEEGKAEEEQGEVEQMRAEGPVPDVSLVAAAAAPGFIEIMFVGIILRKRRALLEDGLIVGGHVEV